MKSFYLVRLVLASIAFVSVGAAHAIADGANGSPSEAADDTSEAIRRVSACADGICKDAEQMKSASRRLQAADERIDPDTFNSLHAGATAANNMGEKAKVQKQALDEVAASSKGRSGSEAIEHARAKDLEIVRSKDSSPLAREMAQTRLDAYEKVKVEAARVKVERQIAITHGIGAAGSGVTPGDSQRRRSRATTDDPKSEGISPGSTENVATANVQSDRNGGTSGTLGSANPNNR